MHVTGVVDGLGWYVLEGHAVHVADAPLQFDEQEYPAEHPFPPDDKRNMLTKIQTIRNIQLLRHVAEYLVDSVDDISYLSTSTTTTDKKTRSWLSFWCTK